MRERFIATASATCQQGCPRKGPKMLRRFICIWNSVFSGVCKFRDLDRRSFGALKNGFVIQSLWHSRKCFLSGQIHKHHPHLVYHQPRAIKAPLVDGNFSSSSSYEFFSLIQTPHQHSQWPRLTSKRKDIPFHFTRTCI